MLSPSTLKELKDILNRISRGESINLEERLLVQRVADKDQSVSSWLRRAQRMQLDDRSRDSVDDLIQNLDLCSSEPNSYYKPDQEDLGDWFMGAPSWLGRS
ncbi:MULTISPECIES: hypothetical protein [Prochlorococcus]|uniref:hypothetical protein n=1 Tax=Prochlorococcus TaxID=1218 RepID=UPI0005337B90|nr:MULTISPECIES: hypothetical protein [Prochlorococcus]KGG12579.1 hypothetical protein EV05_1791 [Prochlorococcus sp. MIT 0601]